MGNRQFLNEKMTEKLSIIDAIDRETACDYFRKEKAISDLLSIAFKAKGQQMMPFGNYNAKIMIVVDFNKTNDRVIELMKKFFTANNKDFYSIYITPFSKTSSLDINKKLIESEISIIKPTRVAILGDFDIDSLNNERYSKGDLIKLLTMLGSEEIKNNNEEEFTELREKFNKIMSFVIAGGSI